MVANVCVLVCTRLVLGFPSNIVNIYVLATAILHVTAASKTTRGGTLRMNVSSGAWVFALSGCVGELQMFGMSLHKPLGLSVSVDIYLL